MLLLFMFAINGLNVLNSYVNRDFMTSIERQDMSGFLGWGLVYVGVFALSTVSAVLYRFIEERLGLMWRVWLSRRLCGFYLQERNYFVLRDQKTIDNPDQANTDGELFWKITNGRSPMPSHRIRFDDEQRWYIVAYLRTLKP